MSKIVFEKIFSWILKYYFHDGFKSWELGTSLVILFAVIILNWILDAIENFDEKDIVLQKMHDLNESYVKSSPETSEKILKEIESILSNYLEKYPEDVDMWLKKALVAVTFPVRDLNRIEKCIVAILEHGKDNIKNVQVLLMLAYVQYVSWGEISEDLWSRLEDSYYNTLNKELGAGIVNLIS